MTALIVVLIVIVAVVVLIGGWAIGVYNQLVKLRNKVQESWRQIDVELNRRYELIPNLVETVKGYAGHESKTLENVIRLRNQAYSAASQGSGVPSQGRIEAETGLTQALHQIVATAEAYPELKADAGFRQLASELSSTEDRIANGRRYYNAVVGSYNTKIESFPQSFIASMGGFRPAGYFSASDPEVRQAPTVDFGNRSVQDHVITDEGADAGQLPSYNEGDQRQLGYNPPRPQADPYPNTYSQPDNFNQNRPMGGQ